MDPRIVTDRKQRVPKLTPLMAAKAGNLDGSVVNFCPHGCQDDQLDEHGYCEHLVGFTDDLETYEPMTVNERGKRVVQVPSKMEGRQEVFVRPPIPRGVKLVQITTSYRVYQKQAETLKG